MSLGLKGLCPMSSAHCPMSSVSRFPSPECAASGLLSGIASSRRSQVRHLVTGGIATARAIRRQGSGRDVRDSQWSRPALRDTSRGSRAASVTKLRAAAPSLSYPSRPPARWCALESSCAGLWRWWWWWRKTDTIRVYAQLQLASRRRSPRQAHSSLQLRHTIPHTMQSRPRAKLVAG